MLLLVIQASCKFLQQSCGVSYSVCFKHVITYSIHLDWKILWSDIHNADSHQWTWPLLDFQYASILTPVAGAIPHHRGALIPAFVVFWTTYTSHAYIALNQKISIVVLEGKAPPQTVTMETAFAVCTRQVFQKVLLAFAYPTAGDPRVIYAIACVGSCWK